MKKRLAMIMAFALLITSTFAGLQAPFSYADEEKITVTATVNWVGLDDGENAPDIQLGLFKQSGANDPEAVVFEDGSGEQNPKTVTSEENSVSWSITPTVGDPEYIYSVRVTDAELNDVNTEGFTAAWSEDPENANSKILTMTKGVSSGNEGGDEQQEENFDLTTNVVWESLSAGAATPALKVGLFRYTSTESEELVDSKTVSGGKGNHTDNIIWEDLKVAADQGNENYSYKIKIIDESDKEVTPLFFNKTASEDGHTITLTSKKNYGEAGSAEAKTVLKSVEADALDGFVIETVELNQNDIADKGFWQALQDKLGDYTGGQKRVNENKILRVIVPTGEYNVENSGNNPICVYSNTILDLRGTNENSGVYTPYNSTDDKGSVHIYSNSHNGNVIRAGKNNENSSGWSYYKNITILGGTIHGKTINGTGIVGSNVRFGHTTNARVIGTKVQDNKGAHHLEAGAIDKFLVADCEFNGYSHGDKSDAKKEFSIEAVQLDVTHREKLNFSDYGVCDDLATKNVTITNNTFSNVFRGVGSHHAVLGSYYENIVIKNNKFTNLADRAINASYFKGGTITNNTMTDVVSGIFASSMVKKQYYQPNKGKAAKTAVETLNSNLKITNNTIVLSGKKTMEDYFAENLLKYGIKAGGDSITSAEATSTANEDKKNNSNASGKGVPAGNYYMTGVTISGNKISVDGTAVTDKSRIKCGMLLWYLKNCSNISANTINLSSKNTDDNTSAGIKVNHSPDNTLKNNTITGVSYGKNALGIQVSDASTNTKVLNNTIAKVAKDAVSYTGIKSGTNNITGNVITDPKKNGITVYKSNATNISSNKITNAADTGIMVDGGTVKNIKSNKVTNSKKNQGIKVIGTVTTVSSNTVNKAGQHGIFVTKGKVSTIFEKNVVKGAKKHGIFTDNGVKYAIGNKLSGNKNNKVGLSKGVAFKAKTASVKKGKKLALSGKLFKSAGTIKWSSSSNKIATVNSSGKVTAKKKGTVTIKAKKNGYTTSIKITVK